MRLESRPLMLPPPPRTVEGVRAVARVGDPGADDLAARPDGRRVRADAFHSGIDLAPPLPSAGFLAQRIAQELAPAPEVELDLRLYRHPGALLYRFAADGEADQPLRRLDA